MPTTYSCARLPRPERSLIELRSSGIVLFSSEGPSSTVGFMASTKSRLRLSTADGTLTILIEAPGPEALQQSQEQLSTHLGPSIDELLPVAWSVPIRPSSLQDDAALLALDGRSWSETSGFPSLRLRQRTTFFTKDGRTPDGLLVAQQHEQLVGMVKIRPKGPFLETAHVMSLMNLVVSPEVRRQGVASALLATAEHVALGQGARKLSLSVLATNTSAIELYHRHGYLVEGRHVGEILINDTYVDDLTLAKTIAG
jgi:ribosomal protein S18 acetylase RimI-like enzyme